MIDTKKRLLVLFSLATISTIFFSFINPGTLPVTLILLPFLLLFLIFYNGAYLLLETFFRFSKKTILVVSLCLSVFPVLLLVIQSITQLTLRDVLLTASIITILIWYVIKVNKPS